MLGRKPDGTRDVAEFRLWCRLARNEQECAKWQKPLHRHCFPHFFSGVGCTKNLHMLLESMGKFSDISGVRFGRLTVISLVSRSPTVWLCRCDCGVERPVKRPNLVSGSTRSCGCLGVETRRNLGLSQKRRTKIDYAAALYLAEYRAWCSMLSRCANPRHKSYGNYGARGIKVCKRWRGSFDLFLRDMGERPGPGMSIDRIDVNGDYTPNNCRWADARTQQNNRTTNRTLAFNGVSANLTEWSKITGLAISTITSRLTLGWPLEKVLSTPARYKSGSTRSRPTL